MQLRQWLVPTNKSLIDAKLMNILIAEDNRMLSDVLCFNLKRSGHEVWPYYRGDTAIERLRQELPDVLLTDYQMPGASGEDLCRFVREHLDCQSLPILVCSAKGLEINPEEFKLRYNVSHIIHKPFSMMEIVELIVRTAQTQRNLSQACT